MYRFASGSFTIEEMTVSLTEEHIVQPRRNAHEINILLNFIDTPGRTGISIEN